MSTLRPHVLAAGQRLIEGRALIRQFHQAGGLGGEVCARLAQLREEILIGLIDAALDDLGESGPAGLLKRMAVVAHAGSGRRDVAPYSDVDLMILHPSSAGRRIAPFVQRLLRDVFDAGLILGHSVRTPDQACRLALQDPSICTSLLESRLVCGDTRLFADYQERFLRKVRRRGRSLAAAFDRARREERIRFGDTPFLLEPNVKRSGGTLRDLQLIRWIGSVRYGTPELESLVERGALSEEDGQVLRQAREFLLRLRNELHFHAGQPTDVLSRAEQLRIAALRGYVPQEGLLPVEQLMREYFRHTRAVQHAAQRFALQARTHGRLTGVVTTALGRRVEEGIRSGPLGLWTPSRRAKILGRDLTAVVRLVDLANLHDQPITPATWEAIRREAARLPTEPPAPAACRHFLSLLDHPARLGPLLRDLHDAGLLERFVPELAHARGLLQFNQYHKFTVDEHCLRAVECATEFGRDAGPLGRVYRPLRPKWLLHLALLLHDLGKGRLEDHREAGIPIAAAAARCLGLDSRDAETLRFLVHKHMLMNHLAFRRDTADERLALDLAVQVGSPDLLQMLYVLTAADLAAVGPGVWDGWKEEILTDLYHRTMQCLAGDSPETTLAEIFRQRREAAGDCLIAEKDDPWFRREIERLPESYLHATSPEQVAADLRLLHGRCAEDVFAQGGYLPETHTCQYTVAASETVAAGIFHRLTGALTGQGLEIRSAQIHTFSDGLVLDRFWVRDPDFDAKPPPDRFQQVAGALVQSLKNPESGLPTFRRTWQAGKPILKAPGVQTRVLADNSTSEFFTILDIFALDRPGLLYAVARTLFELELSVGRAKIGTYLDQVVDVFYVTDNQCRKILDPQRLEAIRRRLLNVVDRSGDIVPNY
ncbi:MAG: [protein-PII] uridylyltransferase [Pirellulales bacterium]|nr:[protein-PII] uridylyltransferase [Pirellulales bacterium]